LATLLGYAIIQLPSYAVDQDKNGDDKNQKHQEIIVEAAAENPWAFVGMIFCILEFGYYLYSEAVGSSEGGVDDQIALKTVQSIKDGTLSLRGAMSNFRGQSWASISKRGQLDEILVKDKDCLDEVRRMCKVLQPFFSEYDTNGDKTIDFDEFRMIFKDVGENLSKEAQWTMFEAADTDRSGNISFEEFVACLMSFALDPATDLSEKPRQQRRTTTSLGKYNEAGAVVEEEDDDEDEEEDMPEDLAGLPAEEQQRRIQKRAFTSMGLGTLLVLVFSDPMVELLTEMGVRLEINAFYVSFVLAPLASNASELVAAYTLAKKKTVKSMTSSLLSLVGAAIMNNTFVLGIFLALVWVSHLAWTFTAETISIVSVELMIALNIYLCNKQTILNGLIVLCFYPLSLGIVYTLENVVGLD